MLGFLNFKNTVRLILADLDAERSKLQAHVAIDQATAKVLLIIGKIIRQRLLPEG